MNKFPNNVKKSKFCLFLIMIVSLVLALTFGVTACSESGNGYDIVIESTTIELDLGKTETLDFTLTKDGAEDAALTATVSVEGDAVTYSEQTGSLTAVKAGSSVVTITISGTSISKQITVNVPTYTLEFSKTTASVDEGETVNLVYTVKKDGKTVTNKGVTLTSSDTDVLTVNSLKKQVTGVAAGTATVTATLTDIPSVTATATYTVNSTFFARSSDLKRGDIDFTNEANGSIEIISGQATALAKRASTEFVFRTTLTFTGGLSNYTSVGVGSFMDNGDNALWFGLLGNGSDGTYSILRRDFLAGWDNRRDDIPTGYQNYKFGSGASIEFVIVRDGDDYWYSIGGLCGTYHDASGLWTNETTWPGIFSQEKTLTASDFSVSYESDDIAAAKAECTKTVAKLIINEAGTTALQRGTNFTYTVTKVAATEVTEAVVWELDKSEMTAGADGTTFENGKIVLALDAAGYVTVKASCGGATAQIRIEIASEELNKSTDVVAAYGGVDLDTETNKVTFTEARNHNNPNLDITQYNELAYMAKLLQTVKGNFTLEFKVANYKSTSTDPVLLVSLGGKGNNFIITKTGIRTYTYNSAADNSYMVGELSAAFGASFDPAAEHSYKIVVADGVYTVYVDNNALSFGGQPIRRIDDFLTDCNIMFTTNAGTSCEVYGFAVTAQDTNVTYYKVNNNATVEDEQATINFTTDGWNGKDRNMTRLYYAKKLSETFSLTMNVRFSAVQNDTKFAICIGNYEFHVNNVNGTLQGELFAGAWLNLKASTAYSATEWTQVTIQRSGGTVYFYIGDTLISSRDNAPSDTVLGFWTYNSNDADAGKTVTFKDLTVKDAFIVLGGDARLQAGGAATYTATAYGTTEAVAWTVDLTNLIKGTVTMENGVLTASGDADGSVVVKATAGDVTKEMTVTILANIPIVTTTDTNLSNVTANGFTLTFGKRSWDSPLATYYKSAPAGDWELSMNLSLSARTTDSKFIVRIDETEYTICVATDYYKAEVRGVWNGTQATDWDYNDIPVVFACKSGVVTLTINGNYVCSTTGTAKAGAVLGFYAFNENDGDADKTVTVSNLALKDLKPAVTTENTAITDITENGFTMTLAYQGEWYPDTSLMAAYKEVVPDGDWELSFRLSYSKMTEDSKFCITIGSGAFTICVSNGSFKVENRDGYGGASVTDWDYTDIAVKLVCTNGFVKLYINDTYVATKNGEETSIAAAAGDTIYFWERNKKDGDLTATVTVTDLTFTVK